MSRRFVRWFTLGALLLVVAALHVPRVHAIWAIGDANAYAPRLACRDGIVFTAANWEHATSMPLHAVYLQDGGYVPLTQQKNVPLPYHNVHMWIDDTGYTAMEHTFAHNYITTSLRWSFTAATDLPVGTRVGVASPIAAVQRTYLIPVADCRLRDVPDHSSNLLWLNQATGDLWMHLMDGQGLIQSKGVGRVADANWRIKGTGDYNGDGQADGLWRHNLSGHLWVGLMNGASLAQGSTLFKRDGESFPIMRAPDANWEIVGQGDYNGDGSADIMWRHRTTGTMWLTMLSRMEILDDLAVYFYNKDQVKTPASLPDQNYQVVGSGDYNGDGMDDILWRNVVTGENWLWLMTRAEINQAIAINTVSDTNWSIVASGDYDGNGASDILWYNRSTREIAMYLMNGGTITASGLVGHLTDNAAQIVGSSDYNNDGKSDLLIRNMVTGVNEMYYLNRNKWLGAAVIQPVRDQKWQVMSATSFVREPEMSSIDQSDDKTSASDGALLVTDPAAVFNMQSHPSTSTSMFDQHVGAQQTGTAVSTSPLVPVSSNVAPAVVPSLSSGIVAPELIGKQRVFVPQITR